MYVDPRVASAKARNVLHFIAQDPRIVQNRIAAALTAAFPPGLMTSRDFRRRLETRLLPSLTKMGITSRVYRGEGYLALQCMAICGDETSGASHLIVEVDSRTMGVCIAEHTTIKPHAVARCLQRNGATSLDEIYNELVAALTIGRIIGDVARESGWLQVGVPTPNGLFIGTRDDSMTTTLHTYVRPGLNGRPSRWDPYVALIGPVPGSLHDPATHADFLGWSEDLPGRLKRGAERIPPLAFLREPYRRSQDPLDAAWTS